MLGWLTVPRTVDRVEAEDFETLEEIHAASFVAPWSADEQAAMARSPGVETFVARRSSPTASRRPVGFITVRTAADEGEVLTMAVHPRHRRGGAGRMLLDAALKHFRSLGVRRVYLEVDPENAPALSLYRARGFETVGERPDYYDTGQDERHDALTLRLTVDGRPDAA